MVSFFPVILPVRIRKDSVVLLAFAWISGLVSGLLTAVQADSSFFSMMRMAPAEHVSIVGLLVALLLPLLINVIALMFLHDAVLLILIHLKAFVWSLIAVGLALCYDSGGVLVSGLFLFSDLLCHPVFLLFWIRRIRREYLHPGWLAGMTAACVMAVLWDYQYISSFLARITI